MNPNQEPKGERWRKVGKGGMTRLRERLKGKKGGKEKEHKAYLYHNSNICKICNMHG